MPDIKCFIKGEPEGNQAGTYWVGTVSEKYAEAGTAIRECHPDILQITDEIPDEAGAVARLRSECRKNLVEKYAFDEDGKIMGRLEKELSIIEKRGYASYIYFLKCLTRECRRQNGNYLLKGDGTSLLTLYLLGISRVNPLKPHYYCELCRDQEYMDGGNVYSGFDLAYVGAESRRKVSGCGDFSRDERRHECHACGMPMTCDGHNIPYQVTLGADGEKAPDIEIAIESEKLWQTVTYAWNLLAKFSGNILPKGELRLVQSDKLAELAEHQQKTGIPAESIDIFSVDLQSYLDSDQAAETFRASDGDGKVMWPAEYGPLNFSSLLYLFGKAHSTVELTLQEQLEHGIFYRDDVYDKLRTYGFGVTDAWNITHYIYAGSAGLKGFTEDQVALLRQAGVPEEYIKALEKVGYLWIKSQAVEYLLNDLHLFWYKHR